MVEKDPITFYLIFMKLKSFILVESSSTFLSEVSGVHVVSQKRARAVFSVPQISMQHLHDVETSVQTDKISQG